MKIRSVFALGCLAGGLVPLGASPPPLPMLYELRSAPQEGRVWFKATIDGRTFVNLTNVAGSTTNVVVSLAMDAPNFVGYKSNSIPFVVFGRPLGPDTNSPIYRSLLPR